MRGFVLERGYGSQSSSHTHYCAVVLRCIRLRQLARASAGRALKGADDQLPCDADGVHRSAVADGRAPGHALGGRAVDGRSRGGEALLKMRRRFKASRASAVVAAVVLACAGAASAAPES